MQSQAQRLAPAGILTSLDRRSENVRVSPIVIAELELGNIERHIFAAHFVECADNTAFEDRPEAFDGLSMDCSDDVLAPGMVHSGMREVFAKTLIASPLISAEQTDLCGNRFRCRPRCGWNSAWRDLR